MLTRTNLISHFNSQPHKEADIVVRCSDSGIFISTHSLTRRLTAKRQYGSTWIRISTHSLTRRLTSTTISRVDESVFQLTASQGG